MHMGEVRLRLRDIDLTGVLIWVLVFSGLEERTISHGTVGNSVF